MMNENQAIAQDQAVFQGFLNRVYLWMAGALVITGLTAMYIGTRIDFLLFLVDNFVLFMGLIIAELALVVVLSSRLQKLSVTAASLIFLVYSVLNGVTLSVIFLIYTEASIYQTFFIAAGLFLVMSAYGYFTKQDLTKIGNILFMGLIGIIIASVVNWFLRNDFFYYIISFIGVILFLGLTAYDTQKLKLIAAQFASQDNSLNEDGSVVVSAGEKKMAVYGALQLYLDFINLFLFLLRLFGRRR